MEKLSDFFSDLKERISNPFIISYLLGWCLWNYTIVVGLIFYKNDELKKDGYDSYLDLIHCNSNTWHFFWLPLFSAIIYTFIFPFIKNLILAFGAWINTWGTNWNLKISKTQHVSTAKYLEYKIKYENAIGEISKYVNEEDNLNTKLKEAYKEKEDISNEFKTFKIESETNSKFYQTQLAIKDEEIKTWQTINSLDGLDGEWYLKITKGMIINGSKQTPDIDEYNLSIQHGEMILINKQGMTSKYYISSVICNFLYMQVHFNMNYGGDPSYDEVWNFKIKNKNTNVLIGTNQKGLKIDLRKKVNIEPPDEQDLT